MGWFWSQGPKSPPSTSANETTSSPPKTTQAPEPQPTDATDLNMTRFLDHLSASEASATPSGSAPNISPAESQYPATMSCRQAFDLALGCQSMAGQGRNIYRYGEFRYCSEQWSDFWFCMRLKGQSGPVSEKMTRDHYRQKERDKYYAPGQNNSEDVWKSREHSLPAGAFFNEPLEPPTENDDQWRRKEIERRMKIREKLGYYQKAE